MNIIKFDFNKMVTLNGNEVMTTSLKVAKYFGKRHSDVLRAIKRIDCSKVFSKRNFASADYIDEQGKLRPMFKMTKDGFIFLVMGFTGKIASLIKENYINAFNWMADKLNNRYSVIEKMLYEHDTKERLSKCRGSIGSKLMNDRKREKKVLTIEYENLLTISQQEMNLTLTA